MGIGLGLCCCGEACEPISRPCIDITYCTPRNTFLQVTLGTVPCADAEFNSGSVYVCDFQSEDADNYYFARNLIGGRTVNVEVTLSKAMSGSCHSEVTVLLHDGVFGILMETVDGQWQQSTPDGYEPCECLSGISFSCFTAARRWETGNEPSSITVEVDNFVDDTCASPICDCFNRSVTFPFAATLAGGIVDGFTYAASFIKSATTYAAPCNNGSYSYNMTLRKLGCASSIQHWVSIVESHSWSNPPGCVGFSQLNFTLDCPTLDRDVDSDIWEPADFTYTEIDPNGVCATHGSVVAITENP